MLLTTQEPGWYLAMTTFQFVFWNALLPGTILIVLVRFYLRRFWRKNLEPILKRVDEILSPNHVAQAKQEIGERIERGVADGLALVLLSLLGVPHQQHQKDGEEKKEPAKD